MESIKDQLRACWQRGGEWRLEFGRLLLAYREQAKHGEWIDFLKTEFDLHRQTAWNWMRKATVADGVPLDEDVEMEDELDDYKQIMEERIADERLERELDNQHAPRRFKMVLAQVSPDEIASYKQQLKADGEFVQTVLRKAFEEILAGPPKAEVGFESEPLPDDVGTEQVISTEVN